MQHPNLTTKVRHHCNNVSRPSRKPSSSHWKLQTHRQHIEENEPNSMSTSCTSVRPVTPRCPDLTTHLQSALAQHLCFLRSFLQPLRLRRHSLHVLLILPLIRSLHVLLIRSRFSPPHQRLNPPYLPKPSSTNKKTHAPLDLKKKLKNQVNSINSAP